METTLSLEQTQALNSIVGRALTTAEINGVTALREAGDHVGVAAALDAMRPSVPRSLAVHEVFDILFATGDYVALKTAQLAGDPRAVLAFAALADASTLGTGTVNLAYAATAQLLDALQNGGPALLTSQGRAQLEAAATVRPQPLDWRDVVQALDAAATPLTSS